MPRLLTRLAVLLAVLGACSLIVIALGAVANADARAKARLLGDGLWEAVTCTPLVGFVGAAVLVVGAGVWWLQRVARGRTRPAQGCR